MAMIDNLCGQKIGMPTVLEMTKERSAKGAVLWKCR